MKDCLRMTKLQKKWNGYSNIVLWGTGFRARQFMQRSGSLFRILFCVDNNADKWGEVFFGHPVCSPEYLSQGRYKVIICCDSIMEISEQIEKMHYEQYQDYISYSLLQSNAIIMNYNNASEEVLKRIKQDGYKLLAVFGNCQSHRLIECFRGICFLGDKYCLLRFPLIQLMSSDFRPQKDIFKQIDVFVTQVISVGNRYNQYWCTERLMELLDKDCQVITIPALFFQGYHPQERQMDSGPRADDREE